jgi:hypothetical protein
MSTTSTRSGLRFGLMVLLPVALAGALRASLGPRWPQVPPLDAATLQHQLHSLGLQPRPLAPLPAWRSEGIALSEQQRYQLQPGVRLQLQLVQVQRRAEFQLAYIDRPWTPGRQLRPQPGAWMRQRCLLSSGSGVTARELGALADRAAQGPQRRLAWLLGLQPNRSWRCLHLRLDADRPSPQVSALWQRLLAGRAELLQLSDPR